MPSNHLSFNFIFRAGIDDLLSPKQKQLLILCNRLAFLEGCIAFCYIIFSAIFYPTLTIFPIVAVGIVMGVYILNAQKIYLLPRILLSVLFPLLCTSYHALIVANSEPVLLGLFMLAFVFCIVPFLIFDGREIKPLVFVTIPNAFLLIFFKQIAWQFESNPPLDSSLFRIPIIEIGSLIMAFAYFVSCLLVLLTVNKKAEERLLNSLHEHEEKNEELEQAQFQAAENMKALEAARKTEQEEQWLQQQLNYLSEEARGAKSQGDLLKRCIKRLVLESGSAMGAFFIPVSDEAESDLTIKATYAYDRQKYLKKIIPFGEGLVGQGWLEKEPIIVHDVPKSYVKIGSGLGKTPPQSVAIIPLVYQGTAVAVLELASLQKMPDVQYKFVVKSGELLASILTDIAQREQLNIALEKLSHTATELE